MYVYRLGCVALVMVINKIQGACAKIYYNAGENNALGRHHNRWVSGFVLHCSQ